MIKIEYDPGQVNYETLLTVLFASHDPTTPNRQGNDVGTQYRSVIFYTSDEQRKIAQKFIDDINSSSTLGRDVVTELVTLPGEAEVGRFYLAENYHQDYFANHPDNPYCELVINPKLEKVQKKFADILK